MVAAQTLADEKVDYKGRQSYNHRCQPGSAPSRFKGLEIPILKTGDHRRHQVFTLEEMVEEYCEKMDADEYDEYLLV